jgi:hypothetical protein
VLKSKKSSYLTITTTVKNFLPSHNAPFF